MKFLLANVEVVKGLLPRVVESLLNEGYGLRVVVEGMAEAKKFSCKECGAPFDAYPPDDAHTTALLEKEEGAVERKYSCTYGHENVLYWIKVKPRLVTA